MTREEAIHVVKSNWPEGRYMLSEALQTLIPELKESEDEMIRKKLLYALSNFGEDNPFYVHALQISKDKVIAWLKKQSEQKLYTFNAIPRLLEMIKPTDRAKEYCQKLIDSLEKEDYKKDAKIVGEILKQWNGEEVPIATMDEQDEQNPEAYFYCKLGGTIPKCSDCKRNHLNSNYKTEEIKNWMAPTSCGTKQCSDYIKQNPTDSVEPKFKAGNWYLCVKDFLGNCGVRFDKGHAYYCGHDGCLQEFDSGAYIDIDKKLYDYFNLWTIQDAKDGDVLSFDNEDSNYHSIGIFKRIASKNEPNGNTYRCYVRYGGFKEELEIPVNGDELHHCGTSAHPVTQEQHDLLFVKIKEAGYEWDAEKKELKKIEPKFKVDDWIVNNNGEPRCFQVIERSWPDSKIKRVEDNLESFLNTATLDEQYHLWTIEDAKSGDILAVDPYFDIEEYPFPFVAIYKSRGSNFFNSYCFTSFEGIFDEQGGSGHILDMLHPATKEQRDFLFQKMKEAGYEWDAEKLELKKIKQHHIAWNEEDEKIYSKIYDLIHAAAYANYDVDEDGKELGEYAKITNWLKSIKEKYTWKPSTEQINILFKYAEQNNYDGSILTSLYNDLKKLKGK